MAKVLVAAGYPLIAGCLAAIIQANGTEFEVVGEAVDGRAVFDILRRSPVDILILSMTLPEGDALDILRRVHAEKPGLRICAVSFADNARFLAVPAVKAGASAFVTKHSEPQVLIEALRRLARGERYVDMAAVEEIMQDIESGGASPDRALSHRETQILQMLTEGRQTGEIADILNLSVKTVSTHRMRLYQKLHVKSVAELVRYAVEHRLIGQ
jgi:DNA-binding NarL/FixJ family response regulator